MGPAMEWIDNYFEESQLLAVNANVSDPTVGRLLAFGTAVSHHGHLNRTVNVAAFARGQTGSDLGTVVEVEVRHAHADRGMRRIG